LETNLPVLALRAIALVFAFGIVILSGLAKRKRGKGKALGAH